MTEHDVVVFGGYDYDFYLECRTCRAELLRSHDELRIEELRAIEAAHVAGE